MNNTQKIVTGFFAISILIIAILFFISISEDNKDKDNDNLNLPAGNVLYYGETCPHCKIVDEFILTNNISSKISFEKKEVFENLNNGPELLRVGKFCKLSSENLGAVPLFYSDEKCYIGSDEVMNFFKSKLNLSSS